MKWSKSIKNNGRKLELQDKIATAVYMAILDVEVDTEDEKIKKMEYINNINKIICNYEELMPIFTDYFERGKIK